MNPIKIKIFEIERDIKNLFLSQPSLLYNSIKNQLIKLNKKKFVKEWVDKYLSDNQRKSCLFFHFYTNKQSLLVLHKVVLFICRI